MRPSAETLRRAAFFAGMAWCGLWLCGADGEVRLPPMPIRFYIDGRPLTLTVTGTVSPVSAGPGQEALRLKLVADLSDVQNNLTVLLRSRLDQSEKCGDRIAVQDAALVPAPPAGNLTTHLHYEKFACAKIAGREITKRLVGGDGTIGVRLTPEIAEGGSLRLAAEVTSVDATGQLGEMLHAGSLGDALREKIRNSVVAALQKVTDLKGTLPPAVQEIVEIRSAEFRDGGAGRLTLEIASEVKVSAAEAARLLDGVKAVRR